MKEKKYISEYSCRVYYEDVDAGGICYHSKYLNFCERARSEFFFAQGSSPIQDDYHFVVKNINANFIQPAHFGDIITIKSSIADFKSASITMLQEVFNENNNLLFRMNITLVCLRDKKISKIPEIYKKIFLLEE